jgi:hypothetical protein
VAERTRDINLSVALGEVQEIRPICLFEDQGVSTFNKVFRDYFAERGLSWTEMPCQVTTLGEICREFVTSPIDFLKIDAEGWEGPILRGADWDNFRPTVLVIEATLPYSHTAAWHDWEPFLIGRCGYHFVYFDGLNRFYVRRESTELEPLFAYPPNVLDQFQVYATAQAERRSAEARLKIDQANANIEAQQQDLTQRIEIERKLCAEITYLQSRLDQRALEFDRLQSELLERTATAESLLDQLEHARQRSTDLERLLIESRLWVGQLSQALAAVNRNTEYTPGQIV